MLKKWRWFFYYKKVINQNKKLLYDKHSIRIDWVSRLYKTYNLTEDDFDNTKQYGKSYVETLLEKDRLKIENTLIDLHIHQFVGLMEIEPLNERQIGVAFRYKHFDVAKYINWFLWLLSLGLIFGICYFTITPILKAIIFTLAIFTVLFLFSRILIIPRVER